MLTSEQVYKKNKKKSAVFKVLSPVAFWTFLALTIVFFILMIKHSVGNITEIINLLDKDIYTGAELEENYAYLIEKYGEWQIVGRTSSIFSVAFVDIKAAMFSGCMKTFMILSIVFLFLAIIVGKVLFPKLAKHYSDTNQDMANIAALRTNEAIMKKSKDKRWF